MWRREDGLRRARVRPQGGTAVALEAVWYQRCIGVVRG
jgi:hypothetical protein